MNLLGTHGEYLIRDFLRIYRNKNKTKNLHKDPNILIEISRYDKYSLNKYKIYLFSDDIFFFNFTHLSTSGDQPVGILFKSVF